MISLHPDRAPCVIFSHYFFSGFETVLTFDYDDDLSLFFAEIEDYLKKGFWLCGYFSYEFGFFLEPSFAGLREKSNIPLAWLGVCPRPLEIHSLDSFKCQPSFFQIGNLSPNIDFNRYCQGIKSIKRFLEDGQSYQVNYTFKNKFDFKGDVFSFYKHLTKMQATNYSAFINTGSDFILSLSPEMFFSMNGERIVTRPMKGTVKRGRSYEQDLENQKWLAGSNKIKAENLMIVDMLRNDLGRVSREVKVPAIFTIEKYPTLYQLTSTVEARLYPGVGMKDIFTSLFPSASVTGAPKIKTMEIIKNIETESRGVYTGAIGYISPDKQACFNVAIRTARIRGGRGEIGVGGGILYESEEKSEYEEAMLKSQFFVRRQWDFSLIETILWVRDEGFFLIEGHFQRLDKSCRYFSIPLNLKELEKKFSRLARELFLSKENAKFKIRVLVDRQGAVTIEKLPFEAAPAPARVKISSYRVNSQDVFLYHKTTRRQVYDYELAAAHARGFFEVIFLNEKEEVTEGAVTNLFIENNGRLYTPAVESGLLAGVLREDLIMQKKVIEKTLYLEDVFAADKVYIGNSVRGLISAKI